MLESWPPELPVNKQQQLVTTAVDWAAAHGLLMRQRMTPAVAAASATSNADKQNSQDNQDKAAHPPLAIHAPVALFPSPYPAAAFERAQQLQPLFNALVDAVARSPQFVDAVIDSLQGGDPFTARLHAIDKQLRASHQGAASSKAFQPIFAAFNRSDYLLHMPSASSPAILQQVELNTISSAFAGLSSIVTDLHTFLADRTDFFNTLSDSTPDIRASALPTNASLSDIANTLAKSWELYGSEKAYVVMVVQPDEHNLYDQRWIEYRLFEQAGIPMMRKTLAQIDDEAKLVGEEQRLFIDGHEIALVYFRAGYSPADHPTEKEWNARKTIEFSHAIKCPPIAYQLAGTKKMQQVLAAPGVLERFVPDASDAAALRSCFTGLYPLDSSAEGLAAYRRALETPNHFVMKPQREGGGNNIYGEHIREALNKMTADERNAYILMDIIRPPPFKNTLIRAGKAVVADVVSELGIYGGYVSDGKTVYLNATAGHLLRTKTSDSDEGGVAAGFAVLDSPFLVDGPPATAATDTIPSVLKH